MSYGKIKKSNLPKFTYRGFGSDTGDCIGDIVFIRLFDEDGMHELPFQIVDDDFEGEVFEGQELEFVGPVGMEGDL